MDFVEKIGKYEESAETWLQGHELLGRDSPQALGCIRVLFKGLWKKGKRER